MAHSKTLPKKRGFKASDMEWVLPSEITITMDSKICT